jgi:type VI secretion system protein ImpH
MLDTLHKDPYRFSLFAALRLLEQVHRDQPRLGESRRAREDRVRLAQPPHMTFAPSEVKAFEIAGDAPAVLESYGFGMFGPNGALPLHLTEIAFQRARQLGDPTFSDFVNMLQHRLIGLFYRAWADADPATNHDRPEADRFRLYIGSLIGLAGAGSQSDVLEHAKLGHAAQFSSHARSAQGLEDVLADYFELPVEVRSFRGGWLQIEPGARTRLGGQDESAALGVGTTLGASSWQCQHQFEIVLGPLTLATLRDFLPGAAALQALAALVRFYTNDEWSWLLQLRLQQSQIPALRLGAGAQLGWTTWLGVRERTADDVVIRGDAVTTRPATMPEPEPMETRTRVSGHE